MEPQRAEALDAYRRKLLEHKRLEAKLKSSLPAKFFHSIRFYRIIAGREKLASLERQHDKSEDDLKALQSIGQVSK